MEPYYVDSDGKIYTVLPYQMLTRHYPFLHYAYRAGVQSRRGILTSISGCPVREQEEIAKADLIRYAELHDLKESTEENAWLTVNRHLCQPKNSKQLNLACLILVVVALLEAIGQMLCPFWNGIYGAIFQLFYLIPFALFYRVMSLPIRAFRVLRGILILLSVLVCLDILVQAAFF